MTGCILASVHVKASDWDFENQRDGYASIGTHGRNRY